MNIVVCVKYVPDATADRQFESDNTVDRVGVDGLLSELDEYAVEQALQIKEKAGDDTDGHRAVRRPGEGRSTRCARRCRWVPTRASTSIDDAIAGSDAVATSLVLAKAIEKAGAGRPRRRAAWPRPTPS